MELTIYVPAEALSFTLGIFSVMMVRALAPLLTVG